MKQESKQLLIQDLSTRLPYGVIVDIKYNEEHGSSDRLIICSEGSLTLNTDLIGLYIEEEIYLKPYLRPMDDMTEEEEFKLNETRCYTQLTLESYDWLNAHHFDYRGLIEKGLAIEAPNDMYEI